MVATSAVQNHEVV